VGGDFNVNPYRDDWTQRAWGHLRSKIGKGDPAGCREVDMKVYRKSVGAIDGVNLCEHFHRKPYLRTHFGNDFLRQGNHGQRIDHIVVSRTLLGGGPTQVTAFETLQDMGGFTGTSDHCPVWCRIEQGKEVLIVRKTGLSEHPYLSLEVGGRQELCLLDTGSALTIFNPGKGQTASTDDVFKLFRQAGGCSMRIRSFAGEMVAEQRVETTVGWDTGKHTGTEGVVLAQHTEGFPRVLLGRKTLLTHMGGIQMKWNEERKTVQVEFGRWPGRVGVCTDQIGTWWQQVRSVSQRKTEWES